MADVIIIGGGPAGSMTGSYLSKAFFIQSKEYRQQIHALL